MSLLPLLWKYPKSMNGDFEQPQSNISSLVQSESGKNALELMSHVDKHRHALTNLVANIKRDGFQVRISLNEYEPCEVSVKQMDHMIIVEGKHDDDDVEKCKHFIKKYTLPKEIDMNGVIATLSLDDILTVVVPPKTKFNESPGMGDVVGRAARRQNANLGKERKVPIERIC